jgi:hypothetical protein
LVAPYYGADEDGTRAGYPKVFVERIQHAYYPQMMIDMLPLTGSQFSVLRLDQTQPIGAHHQAFHKTGYRLSEDALDVLIEWLDWYWYGKILEEGYIHDYQRFIQNEVLGKIV